MIRFVWDRKWTFVTAIIAGLFLAPLMGSLFHNSAYDWYDRTHPVIDYKGELVGRDAVSVLIHIKGKKLRDCLAVENSVQSYVVDMDGNTIDVFEKPVGREEGGSRPVSKVDIGTWKVWPIMKGSKEVMMYVQHTCGEHRVISKMADLPLSDFEIGDKGDKGDTGATGKTGATGPQDKPGAGFWSK